MKVINRSEKEEFWRGHMSKSARFPGSLAAYCRSEGLSIHTFHYWRKRFAKGENRLPRPVSAPFVEVEIERSPERRLPDAAWVAELILHLSRGVR